jgi:urate oxidase
MGKKILESISEVDQVWFSLPNKHIFIYDLARFGIENNSEVFQPQTDPSGLIEGTISRKTLSKL